MSHFVCAVFSNHPKDVEDLLAQYSECVDGNDEFAEYDEVEDCWYNPNAQWDWYSIGGRWSNYLRVKNEYPDSVFKGKNSMPCRIVDFTPDPKRYQEALEHWDEIMSGKSYIKPEYVLDHYHDAQTYAAEAAKFSVFSFVDEYGDWHEQWADESISHFDEKLRDQIEKAIRKDLYITIVDCHI